MGHDARKPVFRVSSKERFKPVCSATEASKKIRISLAASLFYNIFQSENTKALITLREYAGWSAPLLFANPKDMFSHVKVLYIVDQHFYMLVSMFVNKILDTSTIKGIKHLLLHSYHSKCRF